MSYLLLFRFAGQIPAIHQPSVNQLHQDTNASAHQTMWVTHTPQAVVAKATVQMAIKTAHPNQSVKTDVASTLVTKQSVDQIPFASQRTENLYVRVHKTLYLTPWVFSMAV